MKTIYFNGFTSSGATGTVELLRRMLPVIFHLRRILDSLVICLFVTACSLTGKVTLSDVGEVRVTCPEALKYLPGYPSFDDKEAFFNDSLYYRRGFALRDTERGRQAVIDAQNNLDFYLKRFGAAMGADLSEEDTPAIARYLKTTYSFARSGISTAKDAFSRQRPYSYFNETSAVPEDEAAFGAFTSYPSGHSIRAWAITLALIAIDDQHQYEIIKVGNELCESRIITGFHYVSDVEAAKLAASIAFAKIVSDPEYIKLMELACHELKKQ